MLFQVDKPESLLKQRMYNNRCRANSDPTVSYIIVRLYLTAIVSIELQESLDAFNDWFQHFHHNIPVSKMFCSCLFFAGFQIDMRFLQIVFFLVCFAFFWVSQGRMMEHMLTSRRRWRMNNALSSTRYCNPKQSELVLCLVDA